VSAASSREAALAAQEAAVQRQLAEAQALHRCTLPKSVELLKSVELQVASRTSLLIYPIACVRKPERMPGSVRLHGKLSPFPVFTCDVLTTDSCLLCSRNLGVRASLEAARSAASAAKSALDARCAGRISEAPGPCLDQHAS
jgi:hypothetical protein